MKIFDLTKLIIKDINGNTYERIFDKKFTKRTLTQTLNKLNGNGHVSQVILQQAPNKFQVFDYGNINTSNNQKDYYWVPCDKLDSEDYVWNELYDYCSEIHNRIYDFLRKAFYKGGQKFTARNKFIYVDTLGYGYSQPVMNVTFYPEECTIPGLSTIDDVYDLSKHVNKLIDLMPLNIFEYIEPIEPGRNNVHINDDTVSVQFKFQNPTEPLL